MQNADLKAAEMLPTIKLKAWDIFKREWVEFITDGDYDGEYYSCFEWLYNSKTTYVYTRYREYTVDATGKGRASGNTKIYYLHQMVLPPREGYWTHFINGNHLDIRTANLEYRTPAEIAQGRKQRLTTPPKALWLPDEFRSNYRGVSRQREGRKSDGSLVFRRGWRTDVAGKYRGNSKTEEEAARLYDRVAREVWGDRAVLNFPDDYKGKEDT